MPVVRIDMKNKVVGKMSFTAVSGGRFFADDISKELFGIES